MSGRGAGRGAPRAAEPEATLTVRVSPRASRNGIAGYGEGVLKVRLTAPPVEGRANEALAAFLAEAAGVPKRGVEIVAGASGRSKIVRVRGITRGELLRRLGLPGDP